MTAKLKKATHYWGEECGWDSDEVYFPETILKP